MMSSVRKILDFLALRYLAFRGARFLEAGLPPLATFAFDFIGHEINIRGRYEAADLVACFTYLDQAQLVRGTAVDVGANIGNHALFFADRFDQVVSLEPNSRIFELLSFNAKLKGNIRALNIGASNAAGSMRLSFDPANWGGGKIVDNPDRALSTVPVEVRQLDELTELATAQVGLIKIDVEWHELQVLQGATGLLRRCRPVILFEQHSEQIVGGSSEVIDWLKGNGYIRFLTVKTIPSLPSSWTFPGRTVLSGLLHMFLGQRREVVPIRQFENVLYNMIIALPET